MFKEPACLSGGGPLRVPTSTPQLPFKTPHIPSARDQKAVNEGRLDLGVLAFRDL